VTDQNQKPTAGAWPQRSAPERDLAPVARQLGGQVAVLTMQYRHWIRPHRGQRWSQKLKSRAKRYLTAAHRDNLATSCAFSALSSHVNGSSRLRATHQHDLCKSLTGVCGGGDVDGQRLDDAAALMTSRLGGLPLARAVEDKDFSAPILRAAHETPGEVADTALDQTR
jgi:TetR/AcrR family transcriptional repressor of nem operon